jgi:hypothetical protein
MMFPYDLSASRQINGRGQFLDADIQERKGEKEIDR